MPAPRDMVKKYDKAPSREKRKLMGLDVRIKKVIMSEETPEDAAISIEVFLDDKQGEDDQFLHHQSLFFYLTH